MNQNATLKCRDDNASNYAKPTWKFYAVDSKLPKTIYEDGRIVIGDGRFSVDETVDKQYDLMINNADEKNAGSYTCQTSAGSYLAILVILSELVILKLFDCRIYSRPISNSSSVVCQHTFTINYYKFLLNFPMFKC